MPIESLPVPCWVLLAPPCPASGDDGWVEWHDSTECGDLAADVLRRFAATSTTTALPILERSEAPCLLAWCRGCGASLGPPDPAGYGEHFADLEEVSEAAEEAGWSGEWCSVCAGAGLHLLT